MPKKSAQKYYFGVAQEQAVIRYIKSESEEEKNKIFEEYLKEPLIKMVESIIRRYKLFRKDVEFCELHSDTISFLVTKINKFDPSQNHKAYSYFGTICKNYLMGNIQKDAKQTNTFVSYEDISPTINNNSSFSYVIDETTINHKELIFKTKNRIEDFINMSNNLNENETRLGFALIDILSNFENVFQIGEGNKFNKNLILLSLREMTSLTTKEIRCAMRKYKNIYMITMCEFLKK